MFDAGHRTEVEIEAWYVPDGLAGSHTHTTIMFTPKLSYDCSRAIEMWPMFSHDQAPALNLGVIATCPIHRSMLLCRLNT